MNLGFSLYENRLISVGAAGRYFLCSHDHLAVDLFLVSRNISKLRAFYFFVLQGLIEERECGIIFRRSPRERELDSYSHGDPTYNG